MKILFKIVVCQLYFVLYCLFTCFDIIYIFRERKACWTLRGWKENDEDGNEYMVAEEIPKEKPKASKVRFL